MCEKILKVFVADPPATRIAKHNNKLPAGMFVPSISGWLLQTLILLGQRTFRHTVFTSSMVPTSRVRILGLSSLQTGQNLKRSRICVKNMMYFGCFLTSVSISLQVKQTLLRWSYKDKRRFVQWVMLLYLLVLIRMGKWRSNLGLLLHSCIREVSAAWCNDIWQTFHKYVIQTIVWNAQMIQWKDLKFKSTIVIKKTKASYAVTYCMFNILLVNNIFIALWFLNEKEL